MLDRISESKKLADYCLMRMLLKPDGYWSLIFGALSIFNGYIGIWHNHLNIVLFAIGAVMLVEGAMIVKAPSPSMMLAESAVFWILALWNICICMLNTNIGHNLGGWPVIIAIQIFSGFIFIKHYKRFEYLRDYDPSPQSVSDMSKLITGTVKGKSKKESNLIEFAASNRIWKIRLLEDAALLVETRRTDLVYVGKDSFSILDNGKVFIGKSIKIEVQADKRKWKSKMDPEQLAKYTIWKNSAPEPRPSF